jgi:hypothetical protein
MTAIAVKWFPIENGRKKRVLSAAMEYRSSIVLQNLLFRALFEFHKVNVVIIPTVRWEIFLKFFTKSVYCTS